MAVFDGIYLETVIQRNSNTEVHEVWLANRKNPLRIYAALKRYLSQNEFARVATLTGLPEIQAPDRETSLTVVLIIIGVTIIGAPGLIGLFIFVDIFR